jgi:hypothetical protein
VSILEIARLFKGLLEVGANSGRRVNAIQTWGGGADGDSWCCYWATLVLDLFFHFKSPIPCGGVVHTVYMQCKDSGWLIPTPEPGCLFFYVDDAGHAHHIGFVTVAIITGGGYTVSGIAGNTDEQGLSSNGTGCFEHELHAGPHIRYARVPGVG